MATILSRIFRCNSKKILKISECRCLSSVTLSPNVFSVRQYDIRTNNSIHRQKSCVVSNYKLLQQPARYFCEKKKYEIEKSDLPKPSIFQRFKQMYKEYWYVLIPVHLVTSIGWFGGFYYMASR